MNLLSQDEKTDHSSLLEDSSSQPGYKIVTVVTSDRLRSDTVTEVQQSVQIVVGDIRTKTADQMLLEFIQMRERLRREAWLPVHARAARLAAK